MTTKFLDNNIFKFSKFYCRGVSHEKQHFGRFSSLPPRPPPRKKRKFYFYCRLAVSDSNRKLKIATLTAGSAEKPRNEIVNRCVSKSQIPSRYVFCV